MINIKESDADSLLFTIDNVAIGNALRRIMIGSVPTMGIHQVYVEQNDSNLCNEILSHRMGLVVLKTPNEPIEEDVYLDMNVICDDERMPVTPSLLTCSHPGIEPVYPDTIMFYLRRGQRVKIRCIPKMGTSKDHSKWCPVAIKHYEYSPTSLTIGYDAIGQLSAPEILKQSIQILKDKFATIQL